MARTYTRLLYHIVFSTKNREPLIEESWMTDLYSLIGEIVRNRGGELLAGGGISDHIHLLVRIPANYAVSEIVRDVKAVSSGWRHECGDTVFGWQNGYGAFTVSASKAETVTAYIARQQEHHLVQSYQDEFIELLRRHEIEFDVCGLWD
ncbi:IS200/IS605 family transposase [Fimbriiglobus ruber]|uniref:Putative transposase n=1 Tax=Fimbriiglobus ruber TaxID=1908690 RepID=A0A225DVQ8_9BACT|nr:IS200/IS605 family transposase [Fimbriiglobus ruber]OWK41716.1 putative transposase [Fimbriiglobus ruber]